MFLRLACVAAIMAFACMPCAAETNDPLQEIAKEALKQTEEMLRRNHEDTIRRCPAFKEFAEHTARAGAAQHVRRDRTYKIEDRYLRLEVVCEDAKAELADERESIRIRKKVDQACKGKTRWTLCDTACAEKKFRQTVKEVGKICAQPDQERKSSARAELREKACGTLDEISSGIRYKFSDVPKVDPKSQAYKKLIEDCGGGDRYFCLITWFGLEEVGLSPKGLGCEPTRQERADRKRMQDEPLKPKSEEDKAQEACVELAYTQMDDPERDDLIQKCNKAPPDGCEYALTMLKKKKLPTAGLVCDK